MQHFYLFMLQTFQMKYADFYTEVKFNECLTFVVGYNRVSHDLIEIISVEAVDSFGINLFNLLSDKTIYQIYGLIENGETLTMEEI